MPGEVTHDLSLVSAIHPVHRRSAPSQGPVMNDSETGFSLSDGWDLSGLSLEELWLDYLALGGTATAAQIASYARGQQCPDAYQHNMIAQAINEHFIGRGQDHPVAYRDIPFLT